jgi:hypothetical protein
VPIFERRGLQTLDLEPQDRLLDAPGRLPELRQTQNLQLLAPIQRDGVLASCKPALQTVRWRRDRGLLRFSAAVVFSVIDAV